MKITHNFRENFGEKMVLDVDECSNAYPILQPEIPGSILGRPGFEQGSAN